MPEAILYLFDIIKFKVFLCGPLSNEIAFISNYAIVNALTLFAALRWRVVCE